MATKKPQKPVVTLEDFKADEDVVEVTETPEEVVETPVAKPVAKTGYVVKAGDTWRSIAEAKNLDGLKLASLNGHVRLSEGLEIQLG